MIDAKHQTEVNRELEFSTGTWREEPTGSLLRTVFWILVSAACYYLATRIAWVLCLPDSKISLLFPPYALLVSVLLLVPTRQWWAYTIAAACSHFIATQQVHLPPSYALNSEVFDAVQNVSAAAGIRFLIKSPFHLITLREAVIFVLIAVVIVPFGIGLWGASLTVLYHFGTHYWVEWRMLGMSNAVTAIVLIPAILLGVHYISAKWTGFAPRRILEAGFLGVGTLTVGVFAFDHLPAGPEGSPALLYAPIPLLIWAALRFGLGGMSATMLVITVQAIWGSMHGRGPFLAQSPAENVLAFQMFFLMAATPLMLLAVAIGDERRSKEALCESESLNRGIIDSLTSLVVILDRSGRIIAVNDALRKSNQLGGIPLSGADVGVDYLEVCRRAAREGDRSSVEILAGIEGVLAGKETEFQTEYSCVTPAGALWFDLLVTPLRGEAGGAVVKHRDITGRKQTETEAQELRDELAHAGRVNMLGQLSSSLAHELNQPLAAILRNAEAAEIFLKSDTPDLHELRAIVTDIRKDDQRAGGVIDRLRALLQRGQLDLRSLPLGDVIDEVVTLTRADSTTRHVAIEIDVPDELPLVRGDRIHLQQVLLNLLINGMDALTDVADGSRILRVRARQNNDSLVQIAVSDNGHGIPAEKLPHLFEPFFTTKPQGMGLGLPISKTIIEAHGGKLWAENNADGGATFRFTLPVAGGERGEGRGTRGERRGAREEAMR